MTDPREDATGTEARNSIDETIGMDARERKLPSLPRLPDGDAALTPEQRVAIIAAVTAHRKCFRLTQAEIADAIGWSAATLTQVLNGTYSGDVDKVLRAAAAFIEDDARRRSGAKPLGFYETSVFESIRAAATYAKTNALSVSDLDRGAVLGERPRIVIGYGPAGCGKTIGARAYAMEDPRAIYVRVRGGLQRQSALARDIISAVSGRFSRQVRSTPEECYRLLRGSTRLLIVDEGHRLAHAQCEFVRDLSDVCGIPVLILATQEFYERIGRVRRREGSFSYDQFSSRVGYVVDLLRGSDGRGGSKRPFFSIDEVRAIFRRDQVRLTPDAVEYLQALACTVGGGMLRTCTTVFDKAARSAARKGIAVTLALLESSLDASMVPAGLVDDEFRRVVRAQLAVNRGMNGGAAVRAASA